MNKSMNKVIKSHVILAILTVFSVVLLAGGLTYSLFYLENPNTTNQKIALGNLSANLTSGSNKIVLNDLVPESAADITDEDLKYTFTVTNDGDYPIDFEVYLTDETVAFLADAANASYTSYKQLTQEHYKYINYKLDGKEAFSNIASMEIENKTVILRGSLKPGEHEDHYLQFWIDAGAPNEVAGSIVSLDIHMTAGVSGAKVLTVKDLIAKANDVSVTDYSSGNTGEMYTFEHDEATQTTGWSAEERRDYRYIGANPNNWIKFNGEDWRIIGVFTVEKTDGTKEQLIKIIRNESIGNISWDDYTDGSVTNEWTSASLKTLLNGNYYNTANSFNYTYKPSSSSTGATITIPKGLNETARGQIAEVKWYLGGSSEYENLRGPDYYSFERGTTVYSGGSTSTIANVGLMYPSDYIYTYANGVDNTCYTDGYNCRTSSGATQTNGWLYNSSVNQWTISPSVGYSTLAFSVSSAGYVDVNNVSTAIAVRPSVYLTSDIKIISGDGKSSKTAYILG